MPICTNSRLNLHEKTFENFLLIVSCDDVTVSHYYFPRFLLKFASAFAAHPSHAVEPATTQALNQKTCRLMNGFIKASLSV